MNRAFAAAGILALLSIQALPATAADRAVILDGTDFVARTGHAVSLAAKLEVDGFGKKADATIASAISFEAIKDKFFWRRDLKGRKLTFHLGQTQLGEAVTDGNGVGRIEWTPPGTGEFDIRVRFAGDERYAAKEGSLLAAIRSPERKIAVFDIDNTICETSNWDVLRGGVASPPLPGALEVVKKLEADHDVIYLTARMNKFQDVTRRWLDHHGFPRHPVYLLELKRYPLYQEAKYKIETLAAIKQELPLLTLGFGNRNVDAKAYRTYQMDTYILGKAGGVPGAREVANWAEIDRLLFGSSPAAARTQQRLEQFQQLSAP